MTDVICRNCARTNENVVKKILEVRQQFSSSKEKLAAERGSVEPVKRQNRADSTNQVRGKRKALDFSETSTPSTDQSIKPLVTTTEQCIIMARRF